MPVPDALAGVRRPRAVAAPRRGRAFRLGPYFAGFFSAAFLADALAGAFAGALAGAFAAAADGAFGAALPAALAAAFVTLAAAALLPVARALAAGAVVAGVAAVLAPPPSTRVVFDNAARALPAAVCAP